MKSWAWATSFDAPSWQPCPRVPMPLTWERRFGPCGHRTAARLILRLLSGDGCSGERNCFKAFTKGLVGIDVPYLDLRIRKACLGHAPGRVHFLPFSTSQTDSVGR